WSFPPTLRLPDVTQVRRYRVSKPRDSCTHGACAPSPACGGGRGGGSHTRMSQRRPLPTLQPKSDFIRLRPTTCAEIGLARFRMQAGEGVRRIASHTHLSPGRLTGYDSASLGGTQCPRPSTSTPIS